MSNEQKDTDTQEKPKAVNPREAAMAAVVTQAREKRQQDSDEFKQENGIDPAAAFLPDNPAEPVEEVIDQDVEDVNEDTEIVDKPEEEDNNPDQVESRDPIKLKVNGQEVEIPYDEAVTRLQKESSADQKWREAAQMKQEAQQILQSQQSSESTQSDDVTDDAVVDREAVKAALRKFYDEGDEDAVVDVLTQLTPKTQPVDVAGEVRRELLQERDTENLKTAWNKFSNDDQYKHIVGDRILEDHLDRITDELQRDPEFMSHSPSYEDIFNEAGKRVNDWLSSKTGVKAEPPKSEVQDLKRRKGPGIAPRTERPAPAQQAKPKSREDKIAAMAAARGQTIY